MSAEQTQALAAAIVDSIARSPRQAGPVEMDADDFPGADLQAALRAALLTAKASANQRWTDGLASVRGTTDAGSPFRLNIRWSK